VKREDRSLKTIRRVWKSATIEPAPSEEQPIDASIVIAIDAALPWEGRFNEKLGQALYKKDLITDPDTGMEVRLVQYPAGLIWVPTYVAFNHRSNHLKASSCIGLSNLCSHG
jgi:hypothetical protein